MQESEKLALTYLTPLFNKGCVLSFQGVHKLLHLDDVWVQRNFSKAQESELRIHLPRFSNTLKSDDKFCKEFYSGFEH